MRTKKLSLDKYLKFRRLVFLQRKRFSLEIDSNKQAIERSSFLYFFLNGNLLDD